MANSFADTYQDESDKWSSLQIDFLIISHRGNGQLAASIVDPHGDHLADAKAKLRALASFAETYGGTFCEFNPIPKLLTESYTSLICWNLKHAKL
jgi:hypothetical protein